MKNTNLELIGNLVDVTFATAARTNVLVAKKLVELGLTLPLANALWVIRPDATPPAMREVAAELHCDPSTMTFVADRLEEKGLIARRVDPSNRRVKFLELTEAGRDTREQLLLGLANSLPAQHLSLDEQNELYRLLAKGLQLSREQDKS